jgi:hypothetical protein
MHVYIGPLNVNLLDFSDKRPFLAIASPSSDPLSLPSSLTSHRREHDRWYVQCFPGVSNLVAVMLRLSTDPSL